MATEKIVSYTQEQTSEIVKRFTAGEAVEAIAQATGRSVRSIIAKLSYEKVYKARVTETAEVKRVTKSTMIIAIASVVGSNFDKLATLEKASVESLEIVYKFLLAHQAANAQ